MYVGTYVRTYVRDLWRPMYGKTPTLCRRQKSCGAMKIRCFNFVKSFWKSRRYVRTYYIKGLYHEGLDYQRVSVNKWVLVNKGYWLTKGSWLTRVVRKK